MGSVSERELEDFVCEHPEEVFFRGTEIIGRQVKLKHGILDILAWNGEGTYVVELKARPLKEKDIGQVLRYTHDVREGLKQYGFIVNLKSSNDNHPRTLTEKAFWHSWFWYTGWGDETEDVVAIKPILIGPSVDKALLAAATEAGIYIRLWSYDIETGRFSFEFPGLVFWHDDGRDVSSYPAWAEKLGKRIRPLCKQEAQEELERVTNQLFGIG